MSRFVMTLSANDVQGIRQEAYVLIPLGARDEDPGFWGWSGDFSVLPTGQSESRITLRENGSVSDSRIYYVPERSEFRLCSDVYRMGPAYAGCLLVVDRNGPRDFSAEVVCEDESDWTGLHSVLTFETPGGTKRWGYS